MHAGARLARAESRRRDYEQTARVLRLTAAGAEVAAPERRGGVRDVARQPGALRGCKLPANRKQAVKVCLQASHEQRGRLLEYLQHRDVPPDRSCIRPVQAVGRCPLNQSERRACTVFCIIRRG